MTSHSNAGGRGFRLLWWCAMNWWGKGLKYHNVTKFLIQG